MKKVSIITVNFNQPQMTEALLSSIAAVNTYPNIEIIVVDNGSLVNPVPGWEAQYPHVKFIRSNDNLGFAGGNNLGIRAATGDYFFLVNNDTEFTPELVSLLTGTLDQDTGIGIVSPKIHYFDQPGIIQYAGFTHMNYFTIRNNCIGQHEQDNGQYDQSSGPTGFAHGAAMMLPREVVKKAGAMAENFFLYYEEMDWCEMIKRAGYSIWVNTNALIYHKESVSVGKNSKLKEYFMNRNRILFSRRNAGLFQQLVFLIYFTAVVVPRNILSYIRSKQRGFTSVLLRAVWWNMTHAVDSDELGFDLKSK
ncbi:MAG: glycosyltransferase family 2 protein [Filimonas sp.]|nr:glycosyltransferase family 2 protein [Filimonas sp.]